MRVITLTTVTYFQQKENVRSAEVVSPLSIPRASQTLPSFVHNDKKEKRVIHEILQVLP